MGAAVSCVNNGGRQLLLAAASGDQGTVREVLEARPQLATCALLAGNNYITHQAASHGHLEVLRTVVDTLQSSGRDIIEAEPELKGRAMVNWTRYVREVINARNLQGQTPLMLACQNGHSACVRFLLDNFADAFAVDKPMRRNALHYAAAAGRADVVRRLLGDSTRVQTETGYVILRNSMVHDMNGACKYVDARGENGLTALHMAALGGHLAVVQALLAAGASLMVKTIDLDMPSTIKVPAGSTPLHLAAHTGSISIVQSILQAHADAMGNLGVGQERDTVTGRRAWENDGRIDLRSVTNVSRQLPYHVAYVRGFRDCASILNPTRSIDWALESAREMDDGTGPQVLQVLAAYALRKVLLAWLADFKADKDIEAKKRAEREKMQKAVLEARRREALKLHSTASVDDYLNSATAGIAAVSRTDAGHTKVSPVKPPDSGDSAGPIGGLDVVHEVSVEVPQSETLSPRDMQPATAHANQDASGGEAGSGPGSEADRREKSKDSARTSIVSPFAAILDEPFSSPRSTGGQGRGAPLENTPPRRRSMPSPLPSLATPEAEQSGGTQSTLPSVRFNLPGSSDVASSGHSSLLPASRSRSERLASRQSRSRRSSVDQPSGVQDSSVSFTGRRASMTRLQSALSGFRTKSRTNLDEQRQSLMQLWQEATIPGFEDAAHEDDDDCGICLDAPTDIAVDGCNHRLCVECSIQLCEISKKPPLCPFCRNLVCGFHR